MSIIACDPPLGVTTVVENGASVLFNVAIDTHAIEGDFDVHLWHGAVGDDWTDLPLPYITSSDDTIDARLARFQGTLHHDGTSTKYVHFTLKIIVNQRTVWSNDLDPSSDGRIIFRESIIADEVEKYLDFVGEKWRIDQFNQSRSSQNKAWIFQSIVPGSDADESSCLDLSIGKATQILNWFALVRHSTPWLAPRQGDNEVHLDKPGALLSFLRQDGTHLVILPVNGVPGLLVTLQNDDNGKIVARVRNDKPSPVEAQVIIAVDQNHESAISSAITVLESILPQNAGKSVNKGSLGADLTNWYDGFAYCTWNGIGRELNEVNILKALDGLRCQGIPVTNLIIDDNWQTLDAGNSSNPFEYQWTDFEANKENFPQGLGHLTKKIRESHPYIRHIAVWHGIFGYWGGISPNGHIAKCYDTVNVKRQEQESYMRGGKVTTISGAEVARMYDDFYSFLVESGVDSVKADNQYYPDYISGARDRESLIQKYQDAWLAAAEKHFKHRAISCMSQTPQILFHSFFNQKQLPPYLVRNSDDFFPDEPSSHTWHLFCNAHNSILTQHLNILPDWDMFQTAGAFPGMHAAARCLSGGPIYITDVPGQHDKNLIDQITTNTLGRVLHILRPETVGRTLNVYNSLQSPQFLRIGSAHKGSSILGVFNLGDKQRTELVTEHSFRPTLTKCESYIVRRHVVDNTRIFHSRGDFTSVSLAPKEFEILTASPIESCGVFRFATLGLLGKMTGIAVLLENPVHGIVDDRSLFVKLKMRTVGSLGFWLKDAQSFISHDRIRASFRAKERDGQLSVMSRSDSIIVVDLDAVAATGHDYDSHETFEIEIRVMPL